MLENDPSQKKDIHRQDRLSINLASTGLAQIFDDIDAATAIVSKWGDPLAENIQQVAKSLDEMKCRLTRHSLFLGQSLVW